MSLATDLTEYCRGKQIDDIRAMCESLNISYTDILKLKSGYTTTPMIRAKIEKIINKKTEPVLGATQDTRILDALRKDFQGLSVKRKQAFKWVLVFTKKTGCFPSVDDFLVFVESVKNLKSICVNYETILSKRFHRFISEETCIYKFKPKDVSIHLDKFI